MFLLMHYIVVMWWDNMRNYHSWISAILPDDPAKIGTPNTRPQRVLSLLTKFMANMAVSALFFGTKGERSE